MVKDKCREIRNIEEILFTGLGNLIIFDWIQGLKEKIDARKTE